MRVIPETLRTGSSLAEDYISGAGQAHELFEYDYRADDSFTHRAAWLDHSAEQRIDRRHLVDCLRDYNNLHNSHEAVRSAIDLLEQPQTLVVTGGQQSGLFTGPLLVIYKAISVIKAAQSAQKRLHRPVVPVFWIAGEDHDWDEASHTYVLSSDLKPVKITMDQQSHKRSSVSRIMIEPEAWDEAMIQLKRHLPDTEHKENVLNMLDTLLYQASSLSEAFAKLMGMLFGSYGLILLDSADPKLRTLEQPVFERMIQQNDELEQAYHRGAKRIQERGYPVQAEVAEGGANLFYIHEEERLLLFKQNGTLVDRHGVVSYTTEEWIQELHDHPERFSNNVLTRPLMQDMLLPVLGTVLGSGEIAYWAITREAFGVLNLEMPILLPRTSFTFIEPSVSKHMNQFGVDFQQVHQGLSELKDAWLREKDELHMEEHFEAAKKEIQRIYDPVLRQATCLEQGLSRLGATNREYILNQVEFMKNKVRDSLARQHEAGLRQWTSIEQSLFPLGRPQERVYNLFQYMNRYGMDLVDRMMVELEYSSKHYMIYL